MDWERVEALLRRHEGTRDRMYEDSKGTPTIGIGHNLHEPISEAAISQILNDDLRNAYDEVSVRCSWFLDLDDVRQAAIVDMVFNMGLPTFLKFRNTIAFLRAGNYHEAGEEILRGTGKGGKSQYYIDVGPRAERIRHMIQTGEWL